MDGDIRSIFFTLMLQVLANKRQRARKLSNNLIQEQNKTKPRPQREQKAVFKFLACLVHYIIRAFDE